jgi:hypothetical protein
MRNSHLEGEDISFVTLFFKHYVVDRREGISEKYSIMSEKHSIMKGQAMGTLALHRGFQLDGNPVRDWRRAPARMYGIVRRIFAAIDLSQQRQVQREAGRFIAARGGRITDDVERQLMEHFTEMGFWP